MINIVVAVDEQNAIGYQNELLCRLPSDLSHFKQLTTGHTVIMGRKTFESIGKPLPDRENIILSNQTDFAKDKNVMVTNNINQILKLSMKYPSKQFFVIGGQNVYEQFLPYTSTVYLTRIHHTFENVDTFFPELFDSHWVERGGGWSQKTDKDEYDFTIRTFKRKMITMINS